MKLYKIIFGVVLISMSTLFVLKTFFYPDDNLVNYSFTVIGTIFFIMSFYDLFIKKEEDM